MLLSGILLLLPGIITPAFLINFSCSSIFIFPDSNIISCDFLSILCFEISSVLIPKLLAKLFLILTGVESNIFPELKESLEALEALEALFALVILAECDFLSAFECSPIWVFRRASFDSISLTLKFFCVI